MSSTISDLILSPVQARVLEFMKDFWFHHGTPPAFADIAEGIGFCSPSAAAKHVESLVHLGLLVVRRLHRKGHAVKAMYVPTVPFIRVLPNGNGVVLVGAVGGPVTFTIPSWRLWLERALQDTPTPGTELKIF